MTDELWERVSQPEEIKSHGDTYQRTLFPDPANRIGDYQQGQKQWRHYERRP